MIGMRPGGGLQLGHYAGALENWLTAIEGYPGLRNRIEREKA